MFSVQAQKCNKCRQVKSASSFPADFRVDEVKIFKSKRAGTLEPVESLEGPPLHKTCYGCLKLLGNRKNLVPVKESA